MGITSIYISMSGIPMSNPLGGVAKDPKMWWNPVFYTVLITSALILVMSRVGRTNAFWIGATIFTAFSLPSPLSCSASEGTRTGKCRPVTMA